MSTRKRVLLLIFVVLVILSMFIVSLVACGSGLRFNNAANSVDNNQTVIPPVSGDISVDNVNNDNDIVDDDNQSKPSEDVDKPFVDDNNITNEPSIDDNNVTNEPSIDVEEPIEDDVVVMDFSKLDGRYSEVMAPIKNAVSTIFNDLAARGFVDLTNCDNVRITAFRYFYGSAIVIEYEFDVYILKDFFAMEGDKAEFLVCRQSVECENFNEHYCDSYLAYRDFLWEMKKFADLQNFETVKPMAESVAQNLLKDYRGYNSDSDIRHYTNGKHIVISADGSLTNIYELIQAKLNAALSLYKNEAYPYGTKTDFAPIDGEDIYVDLGLWLHEDDTRSNYVQFIVHKGMFEYSFDIELPENSDEIWDSLFVFTGSDRPGYTPSNPNFFNPPNEEYENFFNTILSLNLDFDSAYFYSLGGEDTYLYF